MAGASMNDIKSRIKSVKSTMQITKAMELVATSKLRRAKERAEKTRPYYEALGDIIASVSASGLLKGTAWETPKKSGRTLFIVIAGDRGLAGGYNSNIFRLTRSLAKDGDLYLPIGKKALEYMTHRSLEVYLDSFEYASEVGVGDSISIGEVIANGYKGGDFDRAVIVYTRFVSMLTQTPVYEELLPLDEVGRECQCEFDEGITDSIDKIISGYLGGIIYSCMCESCASEHGARRSAMNSANRNAGEMIDTLMLKYNRARQAIITQEITEIVSGAEAL